MATLKLRRFAGLRPRVAAELLPDEYAQVAHNTYLADGALRGWPAPRKVHSDTGVRTLYAVPDVNGHCGSILRFDHCVSVVDFPAPGTIADLDHLVVWHHDGREPQRYFPARDLWAPLLVPPPQGRLKATLHTPSPRVKDAAWSGPDMCSWVYTWVDQFGVESAPSLPSDPVRRHDDEVWELSGFDVPPPNAEYVRLYRTMPSFDTGEQVENPLDTTWQLVAEVPVSALQSSMLDDVRGKDIEFGTLLTEWDTLPPPDLQGVVGTELGYLVGFRGNDLWFSERHEAHVWPQKYRVNLPDRILSIHAVDDVVYVVTTGYPYRVHISPAASRNELDANIDVIRYPEALPGRSRLSACAAPFGCIYVTIHGLVVLTRQRHQVITADRMGVRNWQQDWAPSHIVYHRGKLFAWRGDSRGWVLDLPEGPDSLDPGDLVTIDQKALVTHRGRDGLLYLANDEGVFVWDDAQGGDAALSWEWRSKRFELPAPVRYTTMKVDLQGEVEVSMVVDGVTVFSDRFAGPSTTKRIAMYPKGIWVELHVRSIRPESVVRGIQLATSCTELNQ